MNHDQHIRWFLSRSDVEAALKLIDLYEFGYSTRITWSSIWRKYIERQWPSLNGDYGKVYETAGEIEANVPGDDVVKAVGAQPRLKIIVDWMHRMLPRDARILDFGCSRGAHAIHISNFVPGWKFVLVDIDDMSINEARKLVSRHAENPRQFEFIVGDEGATFGSTRFDAVVAMEVLEHVLDPRALVDKFERLLVPGGWLFCSVPYGPVEYDMWVNHPERMREHVREWTLEDIVDIFGSKKGFTAQTHVHYASPYVIEQSIGSTVFAFMAGGLTGAIDWRRKLSTEHVFVGTLPGE